VVAARLPSGTTDASLLLLVCSDFGSGFSRQTGPASARLRLEEDIPIRKAKGEIVFVELMPLLGERTVMITVARLNQNSIRVNVIPARQKEDEEAALAIPLSFSGNT
jgi:hypothetical protein